MAATPRAEAGVVSMACELADDERPTVPFRALPIVTIADPFTDAAGQEWTCIVRAWPVGHANCRLCPSCTLAGNVCYVRVNRHVPDSEAALFSLCDLASRDGDVIRGDDVPLRDLQRPG